MNRKPEVLAPAGNWDCVRAAVASIKAYFGGQRVNILSGVMADKDRGEMIETMKPIVPNTRIGGNAFTVSSPAW